MDVKKLLIYKQFLFFLYLISFYYVFLLFPLVKELSGAVGAPFFHIYIKGFLLFVLFLIFFVLFKYSIIKNLGLNLYIFYTFLNLAFLYVIMRYNIIYLIRSFYDTFGILMTGLIFFYFSEEYIVSFKNKNIYYMLFILYIFIVIYGYLQHFFNEPLLFYNKPYYYISKQIHYIRAFSILPSRIEYGKLNAIIASLMLYLIFAKKNNYRFFYFIVFIVSLVAIYFSTERDSFVLFLMFAFNLFLLKLNINLNKIVFLNLILILLIPFLLFNLSISYSISDSLMRTNSLLDRLYWWGYIINNYVINGKILNILFGYGLVQTTNLTSYSVEYTNGKLWIDNLFLTIFLYQGLVGVILFLYFYVKYIFFLFKINTYYSIFFALMLLSWLMSGIFARSIGDIVLFTLVPSIIYIKTLIKRNGLCLILKRK